MNFQVFFGQTPVAASVVYFNFVVFNYQIISRYNVVAYSIFVLPWVCF